MSATKEVDLQSIIWDGNKYFPAGPDGHNGKLGVVMCHTENNVCSTYALFLWFAAPCSREYVHDVVVDDV